MRRSLPNIFSNIYEKDIPVNLNRTDILYYREQLREVRCRIPMVYIDGISQINYNEIKQELFNKDYLDDNYYEAQEVVSKLEGYYLRIPTLHDFITSIK